jgi:DNA-binding phage protein
VAELLAAAPQLKSPGTVFKANFRACVAATAEGNVLAFAQASQTSKPSVTCVLKGRGLPEMGTLLQICHEMDIPLTAFLVDDPGAAASFPFRHCPTTEF